MKEVVETPKKLVLIKNHKKESTSTESLRPTYVYCIIWVKTIVQRIHKLEKVAYVKNGKRYNHR